MNGLELIQGKIRVVGDIDRIFVLMCALEKEAVEAAHARRGHN